VMSARLEGKSRFVALRLFVAAWPPGRKLA
jgi:hypothetical protein